MNPQPVASVRVRCKGDHTHNDVRYAPGSEIIMTPQVAELSLARGDVDLIEEAAPKQEPIQSTETQDEVTTHGSD